MVHVAGALWEAGADGVNFDTAGAGGDADLLATLLAVERLRAAYPAMGIMVGMAAEVVLGTHGELAFRGARLAGLKPRASAGWCRRRAPPSSGPPSTSTRAARSPGTSPGR